MSCLLWKLVTVLSLVWAVGGQSSGDLRLVGSSGRTGGSSGRLEVYYGGRWGTVCDDSFGSNDARVACRQLEFSTYSRYGTVGTLGFSQPLSTTRIWLDELRCLGTESRLIYCPANSIGFQDCSHSEDVALVCTGSTASFSSGDLRLVSSSGQTGGSSGRLEVYYSRQWGTVCDDSFGSSDARVACRQLGFSTYTQYGTVGRLGFSQPSSYTRTWLDELRCSGTESKLIYCRANPIGVEDCGHSEDVALVCTGIYSFTPISLSSVWIGTGVTIPIVIIIVVSVILVCGLMGRRRRLARLQLRTPLVNNATSTAVVVTGTNTQNTAYPMQQSMDQKPQYSNQAPPQNMYAPQPVAAYPTAGDPQYHTSSPQQPPAPYPTGQQPPAQYPTGQQPPAQHPTGQQPPAQYPTGQPPPDQYPTGLQPPAQYPPGQQPPAQYPTGQPPPAQYPPGQPPPAQHPPGQPTPAQYLSGGEAPPAYPD